MIFSKWCLNLDARCGLLDYKLYLILLGEVGSEKGRVGSGEPDHLQKKED